MKHTLKLWTLCCSLFFAAPILAQESANQQHPNIPVGARGHLPKADDGRTLNLDFEKGTLEDWKFEGRAFEGQPIEGEIDKNRTLGADKKSEHTGIYWIGGYEKLQDGPQGTLTSVPFRITHPWASLLVGGGGHQRTRVELVRADTGEVFYQVSGQNIENLRPAIVDLSPHFGERMYIRLVDEHRGGWGHVNFDDFRFHDQEPQFPHPELVIRPAPALENLYPFAGLDPTAAADAMKVPADFRVQLAAAEPDVQQPIAMAIDDRGRLWVAEAFEYPVRAPEGEGRDRILIFEDTTGDGKLDKRSVFIDKLNLVSGLEVGFGGVWIGAAPHLLFIPDRDGDDRPDGPPEVLLDGWGYEDTHETLNAFTWGPDGWLYGCHGVFTHSRVGKPGTPDDKRVPLNAAIWRYHPVEHEFEIFAEGTSNPWGVDFNDYGQAFCTACVIPHLFHVIQGARYERQAGSHFNAYTYDDIKTIADHRHYTGNQWNHGDRRRSDELGGGHAHAGAMIYLGGSWPANYRDQIFMHNIHGQRVNMDTLAARGSGYVGSHGPDFLFTRDQWSQMINLQYGPDGQVWMIDWYDQNQCHHRDEEVHDRSNGRIYRVVYKDAPAANVDLQSASDADLVEALLHENDWYVRHARRVLQERAAAGDLQDQTRGSLAKLAVEHPEATRRLRAAWAVHVTGGIKPSLADRLLNDGDSYVRGWTIQLLLEDRQAGSQLLERLAEMARTDPSQVVRLYIASALQRIELEQRWSILEGLTSHAEDASDHNLPLMYWYAIEPLADVDPKRALALALVGGTNVPVLQDFIVRKIGSSDAGESLKLLVDGLQEADDAAMQLTFLRGMNEALRGRRRVAPPAGWADAYGAVRDSRNAEVRLQALTLAVTFGDRQAAENLAALVQDRQAAVDTRRQALAALLKTRDPRWVPLLQQLLQQEVLRSEALRGLAAFDDAKTPDLILDVYSQLPLEQRRDALATLAARPAYAARLLDAVQKETVPASHLTADLVRQLRNLGSDQLNERIAEVWGTVRETSEDRARQIAQIKQIVENQELSPPDVHLGRAIFATTCQQCHTLFGTGGKVGPELTGSNRANLDYLLSNILDPSAVMAKEYQPSVLLTDSGRVITGIVREETRDALTLQTANERVVIPRDEIEELRQSPLSMMPEDLLTPLDQHQIRSLAAYLASPGQTPILATSENVQQFFNGKDLTGWRGNEQLWSVEDGEIVGKSSGLKQNEFLVSEMAVGDFQLSLEVKLVDNDGNSGIQFRSEPLPGGDVRGYQADIGPGWWGKLYEEHGRGLLWDKSGESYLKPGDWNRYRIVARGHHIQTYLNDKLCVDLQDPKGALRGIIALQLHAGGPMEVRFRNLKLELLDR